LLFLNARFFSCLSTGTEDRGETMRDAQEKQRLERDMKTHAKLDFPVSNVRRLLEPGPIVLVSSMWKRETNIMTMGWHMIMGEEPSLVGCFIWDQNHSYEMIRNSKECVINVPTAAMGTTVVKIGNSSGREIDKFETFKLTRAAGEKVKAPLIEECHASFECRLVDSSLIKNYSLFIFEVVKAHVASAPKFPQTMHYRGDGQFMIAGPTIARYRKLFKPDRL
jgi:flavin reductase (DIM6/NTAB) family NADH-FMN oxidoreductase RutF